MFKDIAIVLCKIAVSLKLRGSMFKSCLRSELTSRVPGIRSLFSILLEQMDNDGGDVSSTPNNVNIHRFFSIIVTEEFLSVYIQHNACAFCNWSYRVR